MSNIIQQLKSLKDTPQAGGMSAAAQTRGRDQLMKAIGGHAPQPEIEGAASGYVRWTLFKTALRPIGVGAAVFVLVLGGWMTTVRAASDSLPGDTLYGLKLVTERAQLAVSSLERRAVLHTEFAERRLEEVVALQARGQSSEVSEAMDAFRDQMTQAEEGLRQLKEEGDDDVVTIASAIDHQIDRLNDSLDSVVASASEEEAEAVGDEVDEAREVADGVSDSAVETIVEVYESSESEVSASALSEAFKAQYNDIVARQTFNLGRVAVIEQTILNNDAVTYGVLGETTIRSLSFRVSDATEPVADAMSLAAAGGYRSAFEIMDGVDAALLALEQELAAIEIAIMTVQLEEIEEEAVEEELEAEEVIEEETAE